MYCIAILLLRSKDIRLAKAVLDHDQSIYDAGFCNRAAFYGDQGLIRQSAQEWPAFDEVSS
jgi:hypothetical protein